MKNIINNRHFIGNVLIPYYQNVLRPLFDQLVTACGNVNATSCFYNYIYGFDVNIPFLKTRNPWRKISSIQTGGAWLPTPPNDHQRRQFYSSPQTFNSIDSLPLNMTIINKCKDFEDLYDYVDQVFKSGDHHNAYLTIYDTAYRIGFNLTPQILPQKYVYLNAGAYTGAENLYGKKWILKNEDKNFVNRKHSKILYSARVKTAKFRSYFGGLDSIGIEAILCIFF